MDRENCELSTQYSIANIRHTLNTRDEFYETEVAYLDDTLPTLGGEEVALSEAIASSPFRPDIEKEFGSRYLSPWICRRSCSARPTSRCASRRAA